MKKTFKTVNSISALYNTLLDEKACRQWILQQLHPDGVYCPYCLLELTDEITVRNFHDLRRCTCSHCNKKFFATNGTFIYRIRLSMKQVFSLMLFIELGLSNKQIADIIGIDIGSVRLWRAKFEIFNHN